MEDLDALAFVQLAALPLGPRDDLGVESRARGVAVAVNGEIVPRADWPRHCVDDGDRVEALSAMQGGCT